SMTVHDLAGGDVAPLLVLPKEFSSRLEQRLAEARVPEVPLPESYRHVPLEEAMPRMLARLFEIPAEIQECRRQRTALAATNRQDLLRARAALADWRAAAAAHAQSAVTTRPPVRRPWWSTSHEKTGAASTRPWCSPTRGCSVRSRR